MTTTDNSIKEFTDEDLEELDKKGVGPFPARHLEWFLRTLSENMADGLRKAHWLYSYREGFTDLDGP